MYGIIDDKMISWAEVEGESMQPTLNALNNKESQTGDIVLVRPIGPFLSVKKIQRGHIVTFKSMVHPTTLNIKRVIGLEGDSIITTRGNEVIIPKGHCWLEGDNIQHSLDSNRVGPVPLGMISGKAVLKLCFTKWTSLKQMLPHSRVTIRNKSSSDDNLPMLKY